LAASAGASYFSGGTGSAGSTQAGYTGTDLSGFTPVASAKGNVFDTPGLSAYSNSVVSSPTIFPFAKGAGLMGEAGPEAIMPLTRTAGGQLGVRALGGAGATAISVQVSIASDGTTSSTTDDPAYEQFGKDLADFVDQRYQKLVSIDLRRGGKINRAITG
jgi:lambda family phage tail tape measure protein